MCYLAAAEVTQRLFCSLTFLSKFHPLFVIGAGREEKVSLPCTCRRTRTSPVFFFPPFVHIRENVEKKGGLTRHENTAHCSRLHNYTEGENYAKIGKKKTFLSFSLFRRLVALINFPLLLLLSALSSPLAISHFQSRRRKRAAKGFTV